MFSIFRRASTPEDFWAWFSANHRSIELLDEFQVGPLMELGAQLHRLDRGLSYEVLAGGDGLHELQISANGNPNLVGLVNALVDEAPVIVNWKVVAFRQPGAKPGAILFEDRVLRSEDVLFLVTKFSRRGKSVDLRLAVPGLTHQNANHLANCVTVLMESVVGELAVMTCFESIEFVPTGEIDSSEYHALTEMVELVADLKNGVKRAAA